MTDLTLILDKRELVARMEDRTIRIDRPGVRPERIPLSMINQVIVMGSPMVSCDVWRALANQNIPSIMLPLRGNNAVSYACPGLSATVHLRVAQYKVALDDNLSLKIAKWLIIEKINGQRRVLKNISDDDLPKNIQDTISNAVDGLENISNINQLMGYEGASAAAYFKLLSSLLADKWNFRGRNRRPPRDPVNALLSLCYVLAGSEIRRIVFSKGFDPAVGFVHSVQNGRESLILDLLEPLRPVLDQFVIGLLDNPLNLKDFTINAQDGCLLNKKGRRTFYPLWNEFKSDSNTEISLLHRIKSIIEDLIKYFP